MIRLSVLFIAVILVAGCKPSKETSVDGAKDTSTPGAAIINQCGDESYISMFPGAAEQLYSWSLSTCSLEQGNLRCWGANTSGQIGIGCVSDSSFARKQPILQDVKLISANHGSNGNYVCAVQNSGALKCWGRHSKALMASGEVTTPKTIIEANPIIDVGTNNERTCYLLSNGQVKCWGFSFAASLDTRTSPTLMTSLGSDTICVVKNNGDLYCWGNNTYGQLGKGDKVNSYVPVKVAISNVSKVAVGEKHVCVLHVDSSVKCWGVSSRLGDANLSDRVSPSGVPLFAGATDIWSNEDTTCARLANGDLRCWGLGIGLGQSLVDYADISYMTNTHSHTCVISKGSSSVKCTGNNGNKNLSDGTTTNRMSFVDTFYFEF